MKKFFRIYFLFICFTLIYSQQYPVRVIPNLFQPYSLRLGDYATSTDNKLQLIVLMTDLMEPQHQTGLKFSLEAGLNAVPLAQSNDFVEGMQPFLLFPGSNLTLTNIDVRALFELRNLNGINAVQYAQPLPDGMYRFCFQAYDYFTKRNLSDKSCVTAFLIQYDPPMLNLPQRGEKVIKRGEFQNLVFQWMPKQVAPNTRYIFTLKELWDLERDPVSGFLTSPPLWQEETYAPTLFYGLDKTQLIAGRRYAWQVQAKSGNPVFDANPTEDNGVYKNNGLSEIYYFDYVENCAVPTLLMAKNAGRGRVELSWSLAGQPSGLYSVQYRKRGSSAYWQTEKSYQPKYLITGLKDQTEYEYRIGSVCGNLQTFNNTNPVTDGDSAGNAYAYSGIQYFTTDGKNQTNPNYQCGVMPEVDISNKKPLQSLLGANEVFMAGDFPVTVISAEGSNGIYSGTGYIVVPYLGDSKVKVSFNNIKLNTDKKLIEGAVETTYDPTERSIVDITPRKKDGNGDVSGDGRNDGNVDNGNNNNGNNNNGNAINSGSENTGNGNNGEKGNNNGGNNNGENNGNDNEVSTNGGNTNGNTGNNGNGTNKNNGDTNSENNNNETTYGIKYLNKVYKDGEILKFTYNRNLTEVPLEMIGGNGEYKVNWDFLKINNEIMTGSGSFAKKQNFNLAKYGAEKFKIVSTAFELDKKPKVSVTVNIDEKTFESSQLTATDESNNKRVAKSNEILYYVNKPTASTEIRKTDFNLSVTNSLSLNDIKLENLNWKIDGTLDEDQEGKLTFTLPIEEKDDKTVMSIAGSPTQTSKTVNVKWVNEDKQSLQVVPPAIQNTVEMIFKNIDQVKKISEKFGKYGIEIKPSVKFSGTQYNVEDSETNFYKSIRVGGVDASVGIKYKVPLPPPYSWNLTIPIIDYKVGEVGAYIDINASLGVNGTLQLEKRNDKQNYLKTKNTIGLKANGGIEFGAKAEFLPEVENTNLTLKAYGKTTLVAEGNLVITDSGSYSFDPKIYINPLVGGVKGTIKVGSYTVFDDSYEWQLSDKISIYP